MDTFPLGANALHPDWRDARFNVAGMFCFEQLVWGYLKTLEKGFNCVAPIDSIHGAPNVLWNGGRVIEMAFRPQELPPALNAFSSAKVGCYLTFSNHRLESRDLADPTCNLLLEMIAQRPDLNGVIVGSDLLAAYIAGKYPSLRQIASVTRVAVEGGKGKPDYYQELGRRFHRFVVHPDDCANPAVLDRLDRDKAEILVNENCLRDCPLRPRHVDAIARRNRITADNQFAAPGITSAADAAAEYRQVEEEAGLVASECPSLPVDRQIGKQRRNCNLTTWEMKSIYQQGFSHFKIQGRRDPVHMFTYDLVRYTLEPEVAAPLVCKVLWRKIVFA